MTVETGLSHCVCDYPLTFQSVFAVLALTQVEGAFVMGLGYWLTEKLLYSESGEITTFNTWVLTDSLWDWKRIYPSSGPKGLTDSLYHIIIHYCRHTNLLPLKIFLLTFVLSY